MSDLWKTSRSSLTGCLPRVAFLDQTDPWSENHSDRPDPLPPTQFRPAMPSYRLQLSAVRQDPHPSLLHLPPTLKTFILTVVIGEQFIDYGLSYIKWVGRTVVDGIFSSVANPHQETHGRHIVQVLSKWMVTWPCQKYRYNFFLQTNYLLIHTQGCLWSKNLYVCISYDKK